MSKRDPIDMSKVRRFTWNGVRPYKSITPPTFTPVMSSAEWNPPMVTPAKTQTNVPSQPTTTSQQVSGGNKFGDSLKELRSATKEGLDGLRSMSGQSGDRDVRLYNRMKPRDFAVLASQIGPNAVFDYVKDMEMRRMRERNNG